MNLHEILVLSCLTLLAFYAKSWLKSISVTTPFPPGPKGRWLIGNVLDVPIKAGWLVFAEWRRRYGDIMSITALGHTMIVLNTFENATALLEKKGNIYSQRPELVMAGELMGLAQTTPMIQYGDTWRKHRKLARIALNPQAVQKYYSMQERMALLYLRALLKNSEEFIPQLRLTVGRIMLGMAYGLTADTADNDYITEAEQTLKMVGRAIVPGAYIVDFLPALKYLPTWFPFFSFQKEGLEGRRQINSFITRPFEHVQREMMNGKASPSFTLDTLNTIEGGHPDRDAMVDIKWAAGSLYGAGGETTFGVVLTFILAMALYPDKQKRAQSEIDSVIGRERLPTLLDRPNLPYVRALITESLRWHAVVPLGLARRSLHDDCHKGYHIKAGSIIIPNIWAISHDDKNYASPEDFIPERFLETQGRVLDPYLYSFGFGRRICPGRYLADNSLYALISSILATFNISKRCHAHGDEIPLEYKFTGGVISYPEPFDCRIWPRSVQAVELISSDVPD